MLRFCTRFESRAVLQGRNLTQIYHDVCAPTFCCLTNGVRKTYEEGGAHKLILGVTFADGLGRKSVRPATAREHQRA
jgi:hypothetical protein